MGDYLKENYRIREEKKEKNNEYAPLRHAISPPQFQRPAPFHDSTLINLHIKTPTDIY